MRTTTALARTSLAAAIAVSAAFGLSACGGSASADTGTSSVSAPAATATVAAVPGGSSAVALDPGFTAALGQLGLTPGTVGTATLADGSVSFPITGGTVTLYDKDSGYRPFVQGVLFHEGSGLSLTAGGTTVELTDFTIDPGDPARLFGNVSVNGELAAASAPLFDLDGSTLQPITMNADGAAVLTGTRVLMSAEAADLLNKTFSTSAVTKGLVVGVATLTVETK
ncbi:hypothetical protein KUM42_19660 [Modestobacter sp. L9-4]|uniref:hypothetical protein n=1 Tax=Modestobacter sp. L9-4 TaxID=2851567 RepID=UPI001C76938D|nr:hypothetical protein [Modestobacter sp. L9-4]QXG75951.1 hypothetical protein KUM42_19660 [Modestobacter sp. L9-4]